MSNNLPEKVYEDRVLSVTAAEIRKGDRIGNDTVDRMVVGPKWIRVFNATGTVLARISTDSLDTVEVTRPVETEESKQVRETALREMVVLDQIENSKNKLKEIGQKVLDTCLAGGPGWSLMSSLFEAQAERQLWARVEHLIGRGKTVQEAMAIQTEAVQEDLLKGYTIRGISRSTNQVSNLQEDVLNEARVDFLRGAWRL